MNKEELARTKEEIAQIVLELRMLICRRFGVESRDVKDLVECYIKQKILQYNRKQYDEIKVNQDGKCITNRL